MYTLINYFFSAHDNVFKLKIWTKNFCDSAQIFRILNFWIEPFFTTFFGCQNVYNLLKKFFSLISYFTNVTEQ